MILLSAMDLNYPTNYRLSGWTCTEYTGFNQAIFDPDQALAGKFANGFNEPENRGRDQSSGQTRSLAGFN